MPQLHLFAGANSAGGFKSLYEELLLDSLNRVYILKGGPGTGKSSLLKKLAREFANYEVVKYHCSADVNSLDGINLEALGITIVDGTAPHLCEPRLPGAVHQLVDLGSCWDGASLRKDRNSIINISKQKTYLYRSVYKWLAIAGGYSDLIQDGKQELSTQAIQDSKTILEMMPSTAPGRNRRAFASAVTGNGLVSYLPIIDEYVPISVHLTGNNRRYNSTVLHQIQVFLEKRNIPATYLYCGLEADLLEHILIPDKLGIFSIHNPHILKNGNYVFGTGETEDAELEDLRNKTLGKSVALLAHARCLHMELERHYTPHVDFKKVDALYQQIYSQIAQDIK